ncbi:unnamed protein product [Cylindrotheca closterium]|uniref:Uncharacterized protein n=1 Tax=Cylindrotheca closterium TaxID=2856 RepID=A0AAD2G283_9STRA|nr:unnamed protein product [Cylindrotheca closterium]
MIDPADIHDNTFDNPSFNDDNNDSDDELAKAAKPRVLAKSLIPTITQGLDASDVLECYTLLRSVPLHGMANSTLHIQKPALGFRYRPLGGTGTAMLTKPVEITLEYGPQRVGTALDRDATPLAQVKDGSAILTWDNEARIYYTTKIVSGRYMSSYYMASMTGTVLEKMLAKAVEFAEQRRKYQPFSVYSPENDKLLKSSSSQDFTSFIWRELASLGVEIAPILPPPMYEPRLWAKSVTKISPEGKVGYDAAMFYSQLYQCLTAIAFNDYTPYIPTAQPSISEGPSIMPSNAPTLSPSTSEQPSVNPSRSDQPSALPSNNNNNDNNNNSTSDGSNSATHNNPLNSTIGGEEDSGGGESNVDGGETVVNQDGEEDNGDDDDGDDDDDVDGDGDDDGDRHDNDMDRDEDENDVGDLDAGNHTRRRRMDEELDPITSIEETKNDDFEVIDEDEELEDVEPSLQPSNSVAPSNFPSSTPTTILMEIDDEAAAHAVKEATSKMHEAENAMVAQAAMDGLLSGDGDSMALVITSSCLMDPQYGIASIDEDGNVTSQVYLYRDGSLYWQLNLVHPYFTVERVKRPLPKPSDLSSDGQGGDFIDWVLALLVMGTVLVGIVMIIHQMNIKILHRYYYLQRWFFNPTEHDYEGDMLVSDSVELGEDAVPITMGGKRTFATAGYRGHSSPHDDFDLPDNFDDDDIAASTGDVEMREISPTSSGLQRMASGESFDGSNDSVDDYASRLMSKHPDMVDLPTLSSKSKVATPVGMANGKRISGDSFDSV